MELTECLETETSSPTRRELSLFDQWYNWPFFEYRSIQWVPAVEIIENQNEFRVYVELPGVDEKDVTTTLSDGQLVVKGEKKSPSEESENLCCCSERGFGAFERTVPLDTSVDADKVRARFEKGVLEVVLPKKEEAKPRVVKIEAK